MTALRFPIAVARGSLTDGAETLLVNASNTNVALGSGVSAAIRGACGRGYQEHIASILQDRRGGPMPPGDVLITDAGSHPSARWVAHVAVMDYREGFTGSSFPTLDLIRRACANLWRAIDELPEDVTVAMVALGAGTGQLGVRNPTRLACETLLASPPSRVKGVTFYGFTLPEHLAVAETVTGIFPDAKCELSDEERELVETMRRDAH
jgi:O-acetyl-ADP-ribose deacetylase (regulator of RNase III)